MRRRNINAGTAEMVVERNGSFQIIPFESETPMSVSRNERRVIRWPMGIDVIGGGAPDNPDNVDVNDAAFPGWRIYRYVDTGTPGVATGPDPLYLEIDNQLPSSWTNAYMVIRLEHVGASATDYTFRVDELSIRSSVSDVITADLTYGNSGVINGTGAYAFQIAATASDGSKRMVMFTNRADVLATVRNSDLARNYYSLRTNPVTLYPALIQERFDDVFMYPTGPNQDINTADIPCIFRFTP